MGEVFNDSETDIKRCIVMIFHCFDALELCGIRVIVKKVNDVAVMNTGCPLLFLQQRAESHKIGLTSSEECVIIQTTAFSAKA